MDQSFLSPVIENVKSVELLRPRKVSYPWTGETHFKVTPDACGNSVFRTSARILVPVNDMNPMAIADSGASHVILPQTALFDSKAAKPVNLRLAAGKINAVDAHREIFAEHVTIPLCPLGRVIRKLQLTAIWTPQTLTLNCVNKSGTAQGLMQCPIKGDGPTSPNFGCFWMAKARSIFHLSGNSCTWQLLLKDQTHGEGASSVSRYDEMQLATTELLCYQDTTRSRSTSNSPDDCELETSSAFRRSSISSNGITSHGIKSTTQCY